MKIVISPWSRPIPNGENAKNYNKWNELVVLLKKYGHKVIQIGKSGEKLIGADEVIFDKSLIEIKQLIKDCDIWISVDNFLQHLATDIKRGIVIWSLSNPELFGDKRNYNLLKDKKYLRPDQFRWWFDVPYQPEAFVDPETILMVVEQARLQKV